MRICRRYRWHRCQSCHRYQQHQQYQWHQSHWYRCCTFTCEYLHEFSKKFEKTLMLFLGAWGFMKKTWSKNLMTLSLLGIENLNYDSGPGSGSGSQLISRIHPDPDWILPGHCCGHWKKYVVKWVPLDSISFYFLISILNKFYEISSSLWKNSNYPALDPN